MDAVATVPAPKGRPREFCTDAALAAALGVFWAKGYEGASLAELTQAMGITKPSLYAAFGNKESLFHKALDLYEAEKLAYMRTALEQPSARAVAEQLLRGAVAAQTDACGPRGCLGVIGSSACGVEAESIRAHVIERQAAVQAVLVERFRGAQADGDLPDHIAPEALTHYLHTVLQGMAVKAGAGATRGELDALVDVVMAMWPTR